MATERTNQFDCWNWISWLCVAASRGCGLEAGSTPISKIYGMKVQNFYDSNHGDTCDSASGDEM